MLDLEKDYIYNLDYVVCLPKNAMGRFETFNYSFGNIFIFEPSKYGVEKFLSFFKKNNIKSIIFVNYYLEYRLVINNLDSSTKIDFIFAHSISSLSDYNNLAEYYGIIELFSKKIINKLAFTDKSLYESFSKNKNVYHLFLDIDKNIEFENNSKDSIGILNSPENPRNSFYNSLSAVAMIKKYSVKFNSKHKESLTFSDMFKIKIKDVEQNIFDNVINLYINFADSINEIILRSCDNGVPCIIGNSNIFDNNLYLKENLVMKSDDDIDEIVYKIKNTIKNKKNIINEYKKFREDYSKLSQTSIKHFLGKEKATKKELSYEKLLTIIVPVYNTSKYLRNCLNSIIEAKIDNMEILIINDGSTDNSKEIILEFKEKYPNLIRYIEQENTGLGRVRNIGLENSKGKYISSIDSDDTIEKETFKESVKYLYDDVDMIIFDWKTIFSEKEFFITKAIEPMLFKHNEYYGILFSSIMPSTCNKIFKKEMFINSNVQYLEGKKYEDLATNVFPILETKTIKYIKKTFYNYLIREGSIMRSEAKTDMMDVINELEKRFFKYFKEAKNEKDFIEKLKFYTYAWRIEDAIINNIYILDIKKRKEYISSFYNVFYDNFLVFLKNNYYKNFVNSLDANKKTFIEKRNQSIIKKEFNEFINKNDDIIKLTPTEILNYFE